MAENGTPLPDGLLNGLLPEVDAHLLARLRGGDVEAGHRFVRDHYPGVYRYLFYLTGHRESAEDLTQETFLQAWRHLDQYEGRAPLRLWLHAIARREFLRSRRRQRDVSSLDEAGELSEPRADAWTDEAELRVLLDQLPEEQREVMLLYYLAGYSSGEIARIVQASERTVRYRLGAARSRLAQALGPGDLLYLNEPSVPMRQWAWLPLDHMHALETRLGMGGVGRWALGVGAEYRTPHAQRLTPNAWSEARQEKSMERREFLRQAAVGAAGLMLSEPEKEIIDSRLTQKVTCAFKGTALSDLCEKLKADTGVPVTAGSSVADEKVTLFCEKLPLREVMRQLSRPFGYTWLRSGQALGVRRQALGDKADEPNAQRLTPNASYRYELVQDLRSQLLEEELRNRDRNAALIALEREIEKYRPYLDLSPDEAFTRAKSASPSEKPLLQTLAGPGWGPVQLYFRLSPSDLAALRAGERLSFSAESGQGERPLPVDVARGVLESLRDVRLIPFDDGWKASRGGSPLVGLPPTSVPEARAMVTLQLVPSEVGQFILDGNSGVFTSSSLARNPHLLTSDGPIAVGKGPVAPPTEGSEANRKLDQEPALRRPVSIVPRATVLQAAGEARSGGAGAKAQQATAPPSPGQATADRKVTTADVLEAVHRATGMPIVADFYTRLYAPDAVSMSNQPLIAVLDQLCGTMRLRWNKEGPWLQFRSETFFSDRPKEVPNRLLMRWAGERQHQGTLTLDDLTEIAQLPDAQLDAEEMAEGAREHWGLAEWSLGRNKILRSHLRYLAGFTPEQRQETTDPTGLPFSQMPLSQQHQFLVYALERQPNQPLQSLDELTGATLRVDYTQPGGFEWAVPGPRYLQFVVPIEPGPQGRRMVTPPVRAQTRDAALRAVRGVDPAIREALLREIQRADPRTDSSLAMNPEAEIAPTSLSLRFVYVPGLLNKRYLRVVEPDADATWSTW